MANMSAFEVLGPIMVGPSSSHTAGALRIARVAASLMNSPVTRVRFTLYNSFSHTYRGHGTDRALVAGILGMDTDDERIRDAHELARKRGLAVEVVEGGDADRLHPNTVDIEMRDACGGTLSVRGESLGGGRVRLSRVEGVAVDISGEYDTLFIAHRDQPGVLADLTMLLSARRINIAFMRTYREERGGRAYTVFELDEAPEEGLVDEVRAREHVDTACFVRVPGAAPASALDETDEFFGKRDAITHDGIPRRTEDGCRRILVDGDDGLRAAHAREMLDRTGNAQTQEELRGNGSTSLPHLVCIVEPSRLDERARAPQIRIKQLRQALHKRKILLGPDTAPHHDEPLRLSDGSRCDRLQVEPAHAWMHRRIERDIGDDPGCNIAGALCAGVPRDRKHPWAHRRHLRAMHGTLDRRHEVSANAGRV